MSPPDGAGDSAVVQAVEFKYSARDATVCFDRLSSQQGILSRSSIHESLRTLSRSKAADKDMWQSHAKEEFLRSTKFNGSLVDNDIKLLGNMFNCGLFERSK